MTPSTTCAGAATWAAKAEQENADDHNEQAAVAREQGRLCVGYVALKDDHNHQDEEQRPGRIRPLHARLLQADHLELLKVKGADDVAFSDNDLPFLNGLANGIDLVFGLALLPGGLGDIEGIIGPDEVTDDAGGGGELVLRQREAEAAGELGAAGPGGQPGGPGRASPRPGRAHFP